MERILYEAHLDLPKCDTNETPLAYGAVDSTPDRMLGILRGRLLAEFGTRRFIYVLIFSSYGVQYG